MPTAFALGVAAASIVAYTVTLAIRAWRAGNVRGGLGLLLFTATVSAVTVYVLLRPLPLP